ncbi:MAG TPA: polysaccharide biosynthesis C-terminal domain-containing protein, partial [Pyrinomonadaceae bacterium]|nr:polysaccharide biosynthesis C-terminal domain-containing protein [Pyrinomonadaceae bacterium]
FQIWTLFGLNLFLSLGDVRRFNLLDWFSQAYIPINAVVVLLVLGRGLDTLIAFNAIATALIAITVFVLMRRLAAAEDGGLGFSADAGLFGRMIKFGLTINVMNAVLALVLRADVFLVNYFRGVGEAGVYAIAAQCSLLLIMFPNVVGTLIFPRVAGMKPGSTEFTSAVIRHAAALQLVLCLLAIPAAFLIPYVYGPDFAPATSQFLILLPGAFAIGLQMMLSQHLAGIGQIRLMPYFWIFTLVLGLGLHFWLIPVYGAAGAAAVSTLIYSVSFLLTLFYFGRHTGERISHVLLFRSADARALLTRFGW